jgi:glucan phosphoethanolaminetransferase (alkaline phosphatase superfamily)
VDPDALVIIDALEAVFSETNNYHRAARALRNRLIGMSLIALVSAGLVVGIQVGMSHVAFVAKPSDVQHIASWQLLVLVMVFGAIGALLTTIRPISTMPPSFSPFNFPLQQALLKVFVGTLTATVGVVLLAGATSSKGFNNLAALLGAAAAFGAAQQVVTRMLDDRANSLISNSPAKASDAP